MALKQLRVREPSKLTSLPLGSRLRVLRILLIAASVLHRGDRGSRDFRKRHSSAPRQSSAARVFNLRADRKYFSVVLKLVSSLSPGKRYTIDPWLRRKAMHGSVEKRECERGRETERGLAERFIAFSLYGVWFSAAISTRGSSSPPGRPHLSRPLPPATPPPVLGSLGLSQARRRATAPPREQWTEINSPSFVFCFLGAHCCRPVDKKTRDSVAVFTSPGPGAPGCCGPLFASRRRRRRRRRYTPPPPPPASVTAAAIPPPPPPPSPPPSPPSTHTRAVSSCCQQLVISVPPPLSLQPPSLFRLS